MQCNQTNTIQINQQIIDEKEAEFNKISHDVQAIHEIYKDLAFLVQNQGEHIDLISNNIEQSVHETNKAVIELEKAEKRQKSKKNRC